MKQSIIAGHCIVKIESILKLCGLEQVMITRTENGERKEYIAMDEIKEAVRQLHNMETQGDKSQEEKVNENIHSR